MRIFYPALIVLILCGSLGAEEKAQPDNTKTDYRIDWTYHGGEYLIYDCSRAHYACVDLEGQNNCVEERKFALQMNARIYPCAPLKKFSHKKLCVLKNYEVVDLNAVKRFCYPK